MPPATTASRRSRSTVVNNNPPPVEVAAPPPPLPTPRTAARSLLEVHRQRQRHEGGRGLLSSIAGVAAAAVAHFSPQRRRNQTTNDNDTLPNIAAESEEAVDPSVDPDAIEGVGGEATDAQIVIMAMNDYTETGDGGDSDDEGHEVDNHYLAMRDTDSDRLVREAANAFDPDEEGEEMSQSTTIPTSTIPGAPEGWFPFSPPEDYSGYKPKNNSTGAPDRFLEVDNPGAFCEL